MVPHELPFSFDDRTLRTTHIKLAAALGFLPEAPKHAYVGGYVPDLGGWVWAVGHNGTILGWDSTSAGAWHAWDSPTARTLRAVAAIREDYAVAVGDGGTILTFDGGQWRHTSAPNVTSDLLAVSFGQTGVAWAVGEHGTTLRLVVGAERWEAVDSGTLEHLRGVWVGPPRVGSETVPRTEDDIVQGLSYRDNFEVAYAVGDRGTLLLWNPTEGSWRNIEHGLTTADFHAIGEHSIVGAGGATLGFYWRMWQKADSTVLQGGIGTARAVWSSYDSSYWAGGDGGIFRGQRYSAFKASRHSDGSVPGADPWELSAVTNGAVTGIAEVSTRFCGYSPNRKACVDAVAVTDAGEVLRYDASVKSWSAFEGTPPMANGLLGLAAVPAGALRLPWPPPNATVLDVTEGGASEVAFTAPLRMIAANWRLAGEDVLRLDFSDLRRPGHYVIHVPGLGISDTFVISEGALDFAAYTTARGLYYQRCGFPGGLKTPHASPRHARPQCHEHLGSASEDGADDGTQKEGKGAIFSHDLMDSPLYNGEPADGETVIDVHGGWHDAGDYGKYILTAAEAIKDLADGFDIDPSKWVHDTWNLPESGNGVPDLLDEMQWELEWMLRMQDSDGGVYHKVTSCNWFFGMPHEEEAPRLINPKSTHDTGFFAAALAAASRVFAAMHPDPAVGERYLAAAVAAWDFLMLHPGNELGEGVPTGGEMRLCGGGKGKKGRERLAPPSAIISCPLLGSWTHLALLRPCASTLAGYGNPPGCHTGAYQDHYDTDNRLWAAAELYRATGERPYGDYVERWYRGEGPRELSSDSGAGGSRLAHAMQAYTEAGNAGHAVDASISFENNRAGSRRDTYVLRLAQAQPFSTGDRIDVPGWIGWGKFTYGSRVVITLLKAWKRTGDQQYYDAAQLAIGPQYGASPLSMSFVTGLGERYPKNPTCEVCLADEVDEPYPGIPIFGIFAHLSNSHPFYKIANHDANNFPYIIWASEDRPVLTRYIDHKQIIPQSEYTISTMSHTIIAVGLLAKHVSRLDVRNATLTLDDGAPFGSLELGLAGRYTMPTASCTWLFDDASLSLLGAGASCSSGGEGNSSDGALRLRVQLGSGSFVASGVALTTRGPEVGYKNYETAQWQQTVVVALAGDGGRRMQADDEAAADAADATASFGTVVGSEQAHYESGVMLTTNASAPEEPVSPFGSPGFDALALAETAGSVGTQIDFSRGSSPEGGQFACPGGCSGLGSCLAEIGQCVCLQGASGDMCEIHSPATEVPPSGPSPSPPPPAPPPTPPPPLYPPFSPLGEGEVIATVVATVVTLGFTVAGEAEAFDDGARASLAAKLQESLHCHKPACLLELRISPASVQVTALLTIPEAIAGSSAAAADVTAAATTLAASDPSSLSSTLGVSVTATTAPTVQQGASVPLVVAPPPPSPPPSQPGAVDTATFIAIAAIVAAACGVLLVAAVLYRRRRRKSGRATVDMDCSPTACFPRQSTDPAVEPQGQAHRPPRGSPPRVHV